MEKVIVHIIVALFLFYVIKTPKAYIFHYFETEAIEEEHNFYQQNICRLCNLKKENRSEVLRLAFTNLFYFIFLVYALRTQNNFYMWVCL